MIQKLLKYNTGLRGEFQNPEAGVYYMNLILDI